MRISIGLKSLATLSVLSFASSAVASNSTDFITTKQLYEQHCTVCHAHHASVLCAQRYYQSAIKPAQECH